MIAALVHQAMNEVRAIEPDPEHPNLYRMLWMIKCIRPGCPGVMTKLMATEQYGPCNLCGATR